MLRILTAALAAALLACLVTTPASAQGDLPGDEAPADELGAPADEPAPSAMDAPEPAPSPEDVALSDEQARLEDQNAPTDVRDSTDPYEDPQEGYYFAGIMMRAFIVPEFMLNLFLDESATATNFAIGGEFTYRKDTFDIIGNIFWMGGFVEGPFRASGDPVEDVEWIDSGLSALFLTGTFLWSTPINDIFAFEYGVGVGLGIVFGDLIRTEANPATTPDGWEPCVGVGQPSANATAAGRSNAGFCDGPAVPDGETGGHYNVIARKWTDGGSVPNVVPYLAIPHLAFRIKPIKQFMMRIEGGFGLGFFVGGSMSYGF